jgi:microcystin-dependent protein
MGGMEQTTLTVQSIPSHTHAQQMAAGGADRRNPRDALFATMKRPGYAAEGASTALDNQVVAVAGSSLPHNNLQPYLCVSFIISLFGIFPSPS